MNAERFPDFYIVGAPKSGTTALYSYLSRHPGVFLPSLKEPHYFLQDIRVIGAYSDLQSYLDLFAAAPAYAACGEASVWYFYSDIAIAKILEAVPDAKVIVMLRNPSQAAEALHAHKVATLTEDIPDFEEAWRAQSDRRAGRRIPLLCEEPFQLQYAGVYDYPPQLRRLKSVVPAEQLKVVVYEEFFADPKKGFDEVLQFLQLPAYRPLEFDQVNVRRTPGSPAMYRLLVAPPAALRPVYRLAVRLSRRFGLGLGRLASRAMRNGKGEKPMLRREFRQELSAHFSPIVSETEALLGRQILAWREPEAD